MIHYLLINLLCLSMLQQSAFELKAGDLIFQESCNGKLSSAIKGVTSSIDDYRFTHVGIVYIDENDSIFIIEATHPFVKKTPLQDYLYPKECTPTSVVARLKPQFKHCIPEALSKALTMLGKEYDYAYDLTNDQYYCSELVYEILKEANNGKPVFELNTMTFKSKKTDDYLPEWTEHYKKLNLPIPEGKLGINPGAMSKSDVIVLIFEY